MCHFTIGSPLLQHGASPLRPLGSARISALVHQYKCLINGVTSTSTSTIINIIIMSHQHYVCVEATHHGSNIYVHINACMCVCMVCMYGVQIITECVGRQWTVALCMARCINQMTLTNVVIFGQPFAGDKNPNHTHTHILAVVICFLLYSTRWLLLILEPFRIYISYLHTFLIFFLLLFSFFLLFLLCLLHFYALHCCQPLRFAAIALRSPLGPSAHPAGCSKLPRTIVR